MGTTLWLLDLDPASGLGSALQDIVEPCGFEVVAVRPTANGRLESIAGEPALIVIVLSPSLLESPEKLLQPLHRQVPEAPIVAMFAGGEPDRIFRLLELGVQDFLSTPLRARDVLPRLWRLQQRECPEAVAAAQLKEKLGLRHLVGESRSFLSAIERIPLVARCDASVLISGETGTGKELIARAIHSLSPRSRKPFLAINCGAIPTELVENELFGHERSAFTGAFSQQDGVVQEAEGGTLLLDEVDSLPLLAQVKLLRFLQEKEYRPLGSARPRKADVRVLAAANGDLDSALRQGRMRQDLYYRLNVIPFHLPALRERREDIPRLAHHFLGRSTDGRARTPRRFSPRALQALLDYDWPGNVRELEHVIERAAVLSQEEGLIREQHILLPHATTVETLESFQRAKARVVTRFEADYIRGLLLAHQGNISRAAKAADKNRRAFWELIRKHGIDARGFRPASL